MEEKSAADKAMEEMLDNSGMQEAKKKKDWQEAYDASVALARKEFSNMAKAWPPEHRYSFAMGMLGYHMYLGSLLAHDFASVVREFNYDREDYERFLFTCLASDCTALTEIAEKLKKG